MLSFAAPTAIRIAAHLAKVFTRLRIVGLLGAILLGALLACGQTGPLRLPDQKDEPAETGNPETTTPHHHNRTADE